VRGIKLNKHRYVGFEHCLTDEDYGIIVSPTGRVKGVWIPNSLEDELVPQAVVELCIASFGIDPNTDEELSQTVH
jgi:hypothetical protein